MVNITVVDRNKVVLSVEAADYARRKYLELPAEDAIIRYAKELHIEKFGDLSETK